MSVDILGVLRGCNEVGESTVCSLRAGRGTDQPSDV